MAQCIIQYQIDQPQLEDRFSKHDLFSQDFAHSCLNRLQLNNNKQMVDLTDPANSLKFAGTLQNPIAKYRPETKVNMVTQSRLELA